MDAFVLRSLDSSSYIKEFISKQENTLGLSCLNVDILESLLFIKRTRIINNAIMLAFKKNSILKLMISKIILNSKISKYHFSNFHHIQNRTGPIFVNNFLAKYIDKSEIYSITLFPYEIFEPCPPFGGGIITENTICIHQMEMTWVSNITKFFIKLYYKFKPIIIFFSYFCPFYYLYLFVKKKNN